MRREAVSCISCLVVTAAAFATPGAPTAQAFSPPPYSRPDTSLVVAIAGAGIDMVRMPTQPPVAGAQPPVFTPASPQPPLPAAPQPVAPTPAPIQPAQPLGRIVKLPVRIGSLPSDAQKGWLGVSSDPLELPLALSLGLPNANGALIVETRIGGPASLVGVRFGDIIVSYDGRAVANPDDMRQRVSSTKPGTEVALEIWRVSADDSDFLRTLRRLGEAGNAAVMYRLGRMYAGGIGIARDDSEAVRWFRGSANAGHLDAASMLAVALIEGRGTAKDVQEAMRLLRDAAGKGSLEAMHRLGVLLANGKVVDKDLQEAVRLLTKAAEGGHTAAMVDFGVMHHQGLGVPVSLATAARWYKRAADLGSPQGILYLGVMYEQGKGVEQNDATAVALYRQAANLGHSFGMHNLGGMLDRGKGVERRDPEQAAEFIMRALELRNPFTYQQMTRFSSQWSAEFRRALQRRLRDAGVYSGRIDGMIRGPTIEAIDAYMKRSQAKDEPAILQPLSKRSL
jgi:TPR repeat protein